MGDKLMKFKTEQDSIDFFIKVLEGRGYTKIKRIEDRYCYYDIEAYKGDKIYRFELKRRNFKAVKYNDCVMEISKYLKFKADKDKYDYCCLVNFFTDYYTVSNIRKPNKIIGVRSAKTTDFKDKTIVDKRFVVYKQDLRFTYNDNIEF